MKTSVKISYTHPGTQPPVYIITSLSSPPWETVKMQLSKEKTEAGEFLFYKEFNGVEEGEYQYKFRLGSGDWWVLDETAETATDDAGNKNNVVIVKVKPILEHTTRGSASAEPPKETAESTAASVFHHTDAVFEATGAPQTRGVAVGDLKSQHMDEEEVPKDESTAKALEAIPIPFTVVEKVPDVEQPQYGDVEADSLHEDASKRAQDAQPNAEYVSPPEAPSMAQEATSPGFLSVSALVVEKIDNEPSYGDDFGEEATSAQKLAHEIRAVDAEPDHVITSRELGSLQTMSYEDPETAEALVNVEKETDTFESDRSPLFAHEAFEEDEDEEEEVPLLPHERSHDPLEAMEDEESFPDEPRAIEGGIPLFAHEVIDSGRRSPILRRESTKRSTTSLHSLQDIHGEHDFNDPSIEPFPTRREDIFDHVAAIGHRLPKDETIDMGSPLNLSPVALRACSSIEPGSPLNPIEENSGDEEEMDLPSPAVGYAKSAVTSAEIPEERIDEVEDDVHNSNGSDDSKDFAKAEASDPAGPLTPPLTPKENKDRYREDPLDTPVAEASTPTKKRTLSISEEATPKPIDEADEYLSAEEVSTPAAKGTELESTKVLRSPESSRPSSLLADNRAATPNSVITPSQNKHEGFFRTVLQVVFGSWLTPLGRFFASLCGGKKNATGVVTAAVIALAAYYLIGAS